MSLPLQGIKILDITANLAGPFCTQILGDFGAEIIKVEDIRGGDPSRNNPPFLGDEGANFFVVNRNKKSLALNFRSDEGKKLFKELAAKCDVVVDSFRPGYMKKLGLDYENLRSVNPRLIYCSMTAYGQEGPMANAASHDANILSLSGITGLTGDGTEKPQLTGAQLGGLAGGSLNAVIAILLAVIHRDKTGQGQFCDVSMLDGSLAFLCNVLGFQSGFGEEVRVFSGQTAFYNIYETKDGGYLSLAAIEHKFWKIFCEVIGRPDLLETHWDIPAQEKMKQEVAAIMLTRTRDEWMQIFSGTDSCVTPVISMDEVCEQAWVKDRDMIYTLPNFRESGMDLKIVGQPIKLSETPAEVKTEFPGLGEHGEEILASIGYSQEQIEAFRRQGIVG
ncbi:MAG: L-carnitine dehydratase/bile acid-inducible protein [Firmicutes bacterium]|nr:L-carnitine dehydratase/bile acid-inducible protein [Bacillota bacterium]